MTSASVTAKRLRCPPLAKSEDSATSSVTENSPFFETPNTQQPSAPIVPYANSTSIKTSRAGDTETALLPRGNADVDCQLAASSAASSSLPSVSGPFSHRRRYSSTSRKPPIGSRTMPGATGRSSTPDVNRSRNQKRSLHASFKFIDDYSPLATGKSGPDRVTEKDPMPLQHLRYCQDAPAIGGQDGTSHYIRRVSVRPSVDSGHQSLDVQCGIGPYRPSCLQKFANKNWMLFWLCWFCAVQGMLVSGLVPSVLSTIERRFNFRAASLGRIMQWYDIGYALCCVPVSYFGGRHSKPVFIGIGLLIMGAGSFIFSLAHIISDAHIYQERTENLGVCSAPGSSGTSSASFASAIFEHSKPMSSIPSDSNFNKTTFMIGCDMLRQQQDSFFSGILTGSFRFEVLFCFAHLLHGIGATPLFTLGVSYIDENVKPTLSSLYIAVFYTFVIIGPAAGFLMSSAFLRYHTDFLSIERQTDIMDIDESDPEWVGAWWIGFQIAAILSLFAVFPILSFPKTLPGALEWQRSRMHRGENLTSARRGSKCVVVSKNATTATTYGFSTAPTDPCTSSPTGYPPAGTSFVMDEPNATDAKRSPLWQRLLMDLRHMPKAVRRLATNPAYMCITLAASVEGLLITGLSGFMAKYLERQFNVASSRANMLIGCIMVPVAGLGTLASGYIVKRFRLTCPRTLRFCITMTVCSLVLSPMFLVLCEPTKLSGIQVPYPTDSRASKNGTDAGGYSVKEPFSLKSQCNNHCVCSEDDFRPVCGTVNNEQTTFFTSCYAGCAEQYHRSKKIYQNCSCVDGNTVTAGWCESKCSALIGFLVLFAPMCLFTFSIGVPALSVVLRCVDYNERSFALGIQWILIRCIGTIPAPAIFAWLFDISCLKRRKSARSDCGLTLDGEESDGSCYIYDNKLLADLFLAFALIGQTVSLIFFVMASVFYRSNGREDLIVSEAPPPTPAAVLTLNEDGTIAGEPSSKFVLDNVARKDSGTVKRMV